MYRKPQSTAFTRKTLAWALPNKRFGLLATTCIGIALFLGIAQPVGHRAAAIQQHGDEERHSVSEHGEPTTEGSQRPVQGLLGHYYTSINYHDPATVDEFWIPVPSGTPDETRIDPQIAFGKDHGFEWVDGVENKQLAWWTPDEASGVIWTGYIRLPKAGTYYFSTVSNGPSAVYLNQARVWLNGNQGGNSVPGEVFSYIEPGSEAALNPSHKVYLVPVTVEAEQILPIEVRYLRHTHRGGPRGIDLYWVTPDSSTDAGGKPLAQIIPAEALYVHAPGPIQTPTTSGIHSTISSDFLDLPVLPETYATLTIRLADAQGRPVPNHRVHVSSLVSYGHSPDAIIQPEHPTDENGVTTARLHGQFPQHDSRLFATDVTDMVDIAQVANVRHLKAENSFLPHTLAPYYDDNKFRVDSLPLVSGRPVTITVPLTNHNQFDAELTVIFRINELNIGAKDWQEIARVSDVKLAPGETREVSAQWTPHESGHCCIRVDLMGRLVPAIATIGPEVLLTPQLALTATLRGAGNVTQSPMGSRQRNLGPVSRGRGNLGPMLRGAFGAPYEASHGTGGGSPNPSGGMPDFSRQPKTPLHADDPGGPIVGEPRPDYVDPSRDPDEFAEFAESAEAITRDLQQEAFDRAETATSTQERASAMAEYEEYKELGDEFSRAAKAWRSGGNEREGQSGFSQPGKDNDRAGFRPEITTQESPPDAELSPLERYDFAKDDRYVEPATSTSDSGRRRPNAVLEASWRFLAAEAAGDAEAMSIHWAGLRHHAGSMANDHRRVAEAIDQQEQTFREDQPTRESLLRRASLHRALATVADKLAFAEIEADSSTRLTSTFAVGNPTDTEATIDLHIRPVSMPPQWQLSIIDASDAASPDETKPLVREEKVGEHYTVRLPAGGSTRVASVLVPVGGVGQNTTARWAVEGKIGDELIGGMMHEMHVPAVDALAQPPGAADIAATIAPADIAPPTSLPGLALIVGVALLALAIGMMTLALRYRNRAAQTAEKRDF